MGIAEIIELLESNKGRLLSAKQISIELNINLKTIQRCLRNSVIKREGVIAAHVYSNKTNHKRWLYGYIKEVQNGSKRHR